MNSRKCHGQDFHFPPGISSMATSYNITPPVHTRSSMNMDLVKNIMRILHALQICYLPSKCTVTLVKAPKPCMLNLIIQMSWTGFPLPSRYSSMATSLNITPPVHTRSSMNMDVINNIMYELYKVIFTVAGHNIHSYCC